jgi:hypothetical protein
MLTTRPLKPLACHFKHFHLFGPLKQHLSGNAFLKMTRVKSSVSVLPTATTKILRLNFPGACKTVENFLNLYGNYLLTYLLTDLLTYSMEQSPS